MTRLPARYLSRPCPHSGADEFPRSVITRYGRVIVVCHHCGVQTDTARKEQARQQALRHPLDLGR